MGPESPLRQRLNTAASIIGRDISFIRRDLFDSDVLKSRNNKNVIEATDAFKFLVGIEENNLAPLFLYLPPDMASENNHHDIIWGPNNSHASIIFNVIYDPYFRQFKGSSLDKYHFNCISLSTLDNNILSIIMRKFTIATNTICGNPVDQISKFVENFSYQEDPLTKEIKISRFPNNGMYYDKGKSFSLNKQPNNEYIIGEYIHNSLYPKNQRS